MPFPFVLPTTSHVSFSDHYTSNTHPSLIVSATTSRGLLRDVLKKYKRLPPQSQADGLNEVLNALNGYLPYLFAINSGLNGIPVGEERVNIASVKELEVEWRSTLSQSIPGREPPRVKICGLWAEISFVLSTLGYVQSLLARRQLHALYDSNSPTSEQRSAAIRTAGQYYSHAHAVHDYLVSGQDQPQATPGLPSPHVLDISIPMFTAMSSMALAEANLLAPTKDDPYPAVVIEERNKDNKDWMFKAPSIPKVRAHLFARVCLAAAEHAAGAHAAIASVGGVDESLMRYLDDLRRTARGKACRFLALDLDLSGNTGEAIAWLRVARKELGLANHLSDDDKKAGKLSKFRRDWAERREDRRIEKGVGWGADAGKFEEARVIDMLEKKWVKMNDTTNVQAIPPSDGLLSRLPSGREFVTSTAFQPPSLDPEMLVQKRAPPDPGDRGFGGLENDSSDEDTTKVDARMAYRSKGGNVAPSSSYY